MSDDQFMKLFKYVEETRQEMNARFDETASKTDVEELRNTVVDFAGHLDTYAQEMAAMALKVDRLERYVQVLADKAGVDLNAIRT